MSILLQLESALADARSALEQAAEKLHDTGVQHALAKSQHDAASDAVKRVEGALNSMHGIIAEPVISQSRPTGSGQATPPAPKKRPRDEGEMCPACGTCGKLSLTTIGTQKFAVCGECNAQHQAA